MYLYYAIFARVLDVRLAQIQNVSMSAQFRKKKKNRKYVRGNHIIEYTMSRVMRAYEVTIIQQY